MGFFTWKNMGSKKAKITILIIFLFLAVNLSNINYAKGENTKKNFKVSEIERMYKIIDKKAGFILEENTIKVIKSPPFVQKKSQNQLPRKQKDYYQKLMYVEATAYSSSFSQCDASPFVTASGTRVRFGTIAANFLPFGTRIKIPDYFGDKIFVVEDRMASRYWYKIDIWMPSYKEAIQFGRKDIKIIILE